LCDNRRSSLTFNIVVTVVIETAVEAVVDTALKNLPIGKVTLEGA
jgi:hypothetical protein